MLRSEPGGVAFRHELARIAIEESLDPERTVLLHRRAVAALTEPAIGAPDLARLAHHAEAAGDTAAAARELEVLPFLAEGLRNAEIAERLVVSHKTVEHHVSAILRKLGVRTRGEASVVASRLGLIEFSEVSARGPSGLA
jgi:DNA-binding NarL/FixJ family response regulator